MAVGECVEGGRGGGVDGEGKGGKRQGVSIGFSGSGEN